MPKIYSDIRAAAVGGLSSVGAIGLGWIDWTGLGNAALIAAVGTTIGYVIKRILDKFFKKPKP